MSKMTETLWVLVACLAVASLALAEEDIHKVDCAKGETITKALQQAKPGDTIRVTGTCKETVIVTTDRVILDGQGTAIVEGRDGGGAGVTFEGVITIDGARGRKH